MVVIAVDCVQYYSIGVDGEIVVAGLEVELDHITIAQLVLYGDRKNGNEYHSLYTIKPYMPKNALQVYTVQPIYMLIKPFDYFMRLHCTCTHFWVNQEVHIIIQPNPLLHVDLYMCEHWSLTAMEGRWKGVMMVAE